MGLFNFGKKNEAQEEPQEQQEQQPRNPGNPTTMLLFRILAIAYVIWMLKDLVVGYVNGGPDAPSIWMVLGAVLVLGGGCVFIGVMTFRQWKQMKEADRLYREEVARQAAEEERLAAEQAALEAEYPDDGRYYEEAAEEAPQEETEDPVQASE